MLFDVVKQLNAMTETLRLISNVAVPVEPGQKVELQVLSGDPDLFVTDSVLDNPVLTGAAQLLTQIPVEIQVEWSVFDSAGEKLEPGKDFLATNGAKGPLVDFIFKPPFLELGTVDPLADHSLIIMASANLRAWPVNVAPNLANTAVPQAVVSKKVPLSLTLSMVPLEIPTMLGFFRFDDFRAMGKSDLTPGFVLLVLPQHSYLQQFAEELNELLVEIEKAIQPIRTLVGLAAFLAGLKILRQALMAQPMLRMFHGKEIDHFKNIHMRYETRFGLDILERDLRPDNRVSSLIFIGIPGRKVTCFVDKNRNLGDGAFELTLGNEMIVILPNLNLNAAALAAHPEVKVIDDTNSGLNNFDDSLSSLRFEN